MGGVGSQEVDSAHLHDILQCVVVTLLEWGIYLYLEFTLCYYSSILYMAMQLSCSHKLQNQRQTDAGYAISCLPLQPNILLLPTSL